MNQQNVLGYKPTCYEAVVIALKENPEAGLKFADYPEFAKRGHSEQEFDDWVLHSRLSLYIGKFGGNDNAKKAYIQALIKFVKVQTRENEVERRQAAAAIGKEIEGITVIEWNAASRQIPKYRLFPNELKALKKAEEFGRGKKVRLKYQDKFGEKEAFCYPYKKIPCNEGGRPDVIVAFSGHQQTGTKLVEAYYHYMYHAYMKNIDMPEVYIASLGLTDNQGLTDWNPEFCFRKFHEYGMYFAHARFGGLPQGLLDKLRMEDVKDTSTEENIGFLIETLNRYNLSDVNLIFLGYPVYQMRIMTEFAKGFATRENAPNVHIRIADIAPKKFDDEDELLTALVQDKLSQEEFYSLYDFDTFRILSYDRFDAQLFDLISNCCANILRQTTGENATRFPLPGRESLPDELKPLLQLALAYSYKNIPHELCGTDENVALALKLNRSTMLWQHDCGYSGEIQDKQQVYYAIETNQKLIKEGLVSVKLLTEGPDMEEEEFVDKLFEFYEETMSRE